MDKIIASYRERQEQLVGSSTDILNKAEAEKRELSTEERTNVTANEAEFDRLDQEIKLREGVLARGQSLATPAGRKTDPDSATNGNPQNNSAPAPTQGTRVLGAVARHSGTLGFSHFGEFAAAVRHAANGGERDARLNAAAASSVSSEGNGADGGFAVPPDYRSTLVERVFGEDSLYARTDRLTSSSNTITVPVDETTVWGSSGVKAYWENEQAAITQSKVNLRSNTLRLHKVAALVPITEELMEDAPALGTYIERRAPASIDFAVSNAIVRGLGTGQPLGFMASPSLVTVAAEGGQSADTINVQNVTKMYARMPAASKARAVWLIHSDAMPQLMTLTLGGSAAATPMFIPPGGIANQPFASLFGRPVIEHEVCETVGDVGDIMFVDLSQYMTAVKAQGLKQQTSMHLWFDQDLVAFKFTFRIAGQPWWSSAQDPRDGSSAKSPFVTLAAR